MRKINIILSFMLVLFLTACELEQFPSDSMSAEKAFDSEKVIEQVTLGQYNTMKVGILIRGKRSWQYNIPRGIDLVNLQGDDMFITNSYLDLTSFNQYTIESWKVDGGFNLSLWAAYYKNIAVCNRVIASVGGTTDGENNLLGENYYLRALWYLSLSRIYGRPYTHGRDNLCVPLRIDANSIDGQKRVTVGEVYDQILSDLKMAVELLPSVTTFARPSKEAAWGLLSRVYLWMADPQDAGTQEYADLAIAYADSVITSGNFLLTPTISYFGSDVKRAKTIPVGTPINHYFSRAKSEPETVFCLGIDDTDLGIIARGRMWLQTADGQGFGQYCASSYYRDILASDPGDLRGNFIEPRYQYDPETGEVLQDDDGNDLLYQHKGYDQYNINKFSYLGELPFSADIIYQRLSEVYLNRAEGYAKKALYGDGASIQKALDDVNVIRTRAMAATYNTIADFEAVYPTNPGSPVDIGETPNAADILDVVLTERFLELAWEFNRGWDVFRNKRNLFRNYSGPHVTKGIIPWDNNRIVAPIPLEETYANPLLEQNPG